MAKSKDTEIDAYIFIKENLKTLGWDTRNPARTPTGEVYTQTETTLTTSTLAAGEVLGLTKPTTTSDNILISIYYNVTKQKR